MNAAIHGRIAVAVVAVPTIGLALMTAAIAWMGGDLLQLALDRDVGSSEVLPFVAVVVGFFFVCCIVVAIQGLRFSHRIAGPAFRLKSALERIRSGDLSFRVHLRKGDYLMEVADELNLVLDWLNENPPQGTTRGSDLVVVDRASVSAEHGDLDLEELIDLAPREERPVEGR